MQKDHIKFTGYGGAWIATTGEKRAKGIANGEKSEAEKQKRHPLASHRGEKRINRRVFPLQESGKKVGEKEKKKMREGRGKPLENQ